MTPITKIFVATLLSSILLLSHCSSPAGEEEEKKPWDYGPWDYYCYETGLFSCIFMISANDGWACDGLNSIYRFNGSEWVLNKSFEGIAPVTYMNDLDFSAPDDGWAVGASMYPDTGYIFHYDGRDWEDVTPFHIRWLAAVEALAPDDVWVAGGYGDVFHYDGSSWEQIPFPPSNELAGLHFPAPDDGWAVGANGTCSHYDGVQWRAVDMDSFEHRYGVFFPTREEGWAVGGGGLMPEAPPWYPILHYENGAWNDMFYAQMKLLAVHFASPSDGWAVGTDILRYDGKKWHVVTPPGKLVALDVFTLGGDEVWLACDHGTICKYNPNK